MFGTWVHELTRNCGSLARSALFTIELAGQPRNCGQPHSLKPWGEFAKVLKPLAERQKLCQNWCLVCSDVAV